MKVLVAAPYPTMGGPAATQSLDLVRSLLATGHEVEVASPLVSAAHHVADLGGVRGAVTLARLAPGFDRVVVRFDATALAADQSVPRLMPARLALSAALRRAKTLDLHLDRVPARLDERFVQLVLSTAREVAVSSGEEAAVLERAGIDEDRIRVTDSPRSRLTRSQVANGPWRLSAGPSRQELQAAVRARATAARSGENGRAVAGTTARPLSEPVRQVEPLGTAPAQSPKPGVAFLKRVLRRLTGWQVDPVIQHVNHLQQAIVSALDQLETRAEKPRGRDDNTSS